MKLLIFDTETTGLPKYSSIKAEFKQDNWPHIVSIAWVILDSDTNEILTKKKYIIKPNWLIPQESIDIHGITTKYATDFGVDLHTAITNLLQVEHDVIVAHNMNFDMNVLVNAIRWDLQCIPPIMKPAFCTMELSKDICKLPRWTGNGYKNPKLSELFFFATKKQPNGKLHDSLYDALILTLVIKLCNPLREKMGLRIKPQIKVDETNAGTNNDRITTNLE